MEEDPVSKQAFSKARAGLNPEFVRKFADGIASVHARDEAAPSYQGMRLIAIDGTDIALEKGNGQGALSKCRPVIYHGGWRRK